MLGVTELLIAVSVVLLVLVSKGIIPIPKAIRNIAFEPREESRRMEPVRKETADLPPADRFYGQREYVEARPYKAEPIKVVIQQREKGGGLGKFVVIAICIGYILFPVDCIPDFIPVLGWADDFIAGMIGLRALIK